MDSLKPQDSLMTPNSTPASTQSVLIGLSALVLAAVLLFVSGLISGWYHLHAEVAAVLAALGRNRNTAVTPKDTFCVMISTICS